MITKATKIDICDWNLKIPSQTIVSSEDKKNIFTLELKLKTNILKKELQQLVDDNK